ncbi:rhomboid family protein [Hufsiella ginkgonis]|uniref:Rhomboid family intramembrane serine protease n=1 Tax=Hufsiella ginkgonis TaxID=2695274 RepID=A0A7K1Y104_9SPHI|nr:rhomboid family intramembrane serine protease [Hufsiella ginkgonis]MXV16930.1 rhomboid family intramembrane serine protease [Hufsiella ginkgonis]
MRRPYQNPSKFDLFKGSRINLFIAVNVAVFLVINVVGFLFNKTSVFNDWLEINLSMPSDLPALAFKFWTPFTYMFTHADFWHIFFNMIWLFWIGSILEDFLNKKQITFIYIAGGLAGGILFLLAFNLFPAFREMKGSSILLGASGSVTAIVLAAAVLLPEYGIMLFGVLELRLKYLALIFVAMDVLGIVKNPGGSFAHIGGALLGFIYIRQLQSGNDWSRLFQKQRKLKVVSRGNPGGATIPDQEVIDRILDKISRSGIESLSKQEKEQLSNLSKSNETKER